MMNDYCKAMRSFFTQCGVIACSLIYCYLQSMNIEVRCSKSNTQLEKYVLSKLKCPVLLFASFFFRQFITLHVTVCIIFPNSLLTQVLDTLKCG